MPKTPKNEPATDEKFPASATPAVAAEPAAAPAKKRAKSAKAPAAKKNSTKKKSAGGAAKKSAAKRRSGSAPRGDDVQRSEPAEPSDADIRLRAYFIAERRVQLALQGDPARDWIEARQQLIEESRQSRS